MNVFKLIFAVVVSILFFVKDLSAQPKSEVATDYLEALTRFEPWAESVWKDHPEIPGSGYFGDGASQGNGGIRGNCGIALSYAVLTLEFPDAPERQHRLKRVEAALRYATETHISGPDNVFAVNGKKWGVVPETPKNERRGWQSSMWASSMGLTAALLEKELDPKVVQACKRVVAAEADWLSERQPPSGYKLDSKAEENAWQSNIPALAAAWMSNDTRYAKWLKTAKLYMANTYTVSADSASPLKKWIMTQTLYPSYAMENHGFYHPIYQMVSGMSLGDAYLMTSMINPEVAKELQPFAEHNVLNVWKFVKEILLNNGELAFPSGLDWSLHSFEHVSYLAFLATHFKQPEAQWTEVQLAKRILERQAVNGDGQFVGESCPNGFYREGVEVRRISIAYLHNKLAGFPTAKGLKPQEELTHHKDVGLIVQRSKNALTTVSYGARTLALVYPLNGKNPGEQFFTSPNTTSLIGGAGRKGTLKNYTPTSTGFKAEFELVNKEGGKSDMYIENLPEMTVCIEMPIDTQELSMNWFLTAVENHPLTGGHRTLLWPNNSITLKERSGEKQTIFSNWVNIDNWMGYVTRPGEEFIYQTAGKYNRSGAAEDPLILQSRYNNQPRFIIILPGKDAKATAAIAKNLKWEVSGSKCRLSALLPNGKKVKIKVDRKGL